MISRGATESTSSQRPARRGERPWLGCLVSAVLLTLAPPLAGVSMMLGTMDFMVRWGYSFNAASFGALPSFVLMVGPPAILLVTVISVLPAVAISRLFSLPRGLLVGVVIGPWLVFTLGLRRLFDPQPQSGISGWLGWGVLTAPAFLVSALALYLLVACRPARRLLAALLLPPALLLALVHATAWGGAGTVFQYSESKPHPGEPQ